MTKVSPTPTLLPPPQPSIPLPNPPPKGEGAIALPPTGGKMEGGNGRGSDRPSPHRGEAGREERESGQTYLLSAGEAQKISVLAQQLNNPEAAGSYSLQCSVDELCNATGVTGFALFDADLKGIKGKQNFLNVLAKAAGFPPEFGANWDALADELCDLSWQQASGYVLLLRNASNTLGLSANDREIALDIFADTAVYWRQRNKPFWIFFS